MLTIANVTKRFGDALALRDVSLSVSAGELLVLIGSSGSGKTTLLRSIAGIETPSSGSIFIDGNDTVNVPPYDREVDIVFQQLGLFPYLSARGNIELGASKGVLAAAAQHAIEAAAKARVPKKLLDQHIQDLSGGEKQRVALARSFAARPRVWLLDEPLSSVDVVLRKELRHAVRDLHQEIGCATIYVTHDREDAFALADRIAVIHEGELLQVGTPREVYEEPKSRVAAMLTGDVNIVGSARVIGDSDPHVLGIRPEYTRVSNDTGVVGAVVDSRAVGTSVHTHVKIPSGEVCLVYTDDVMEVGHEIGLEFDPDRLLTLRDDSF